jgi:tetratricopeptide (TPR) repeat protein
MAIVHAGLLLACGEATRAQYVTQFYHFRPGIPKSIDSVLASLAHAARQAAKPSDAATQAGVELFDAGDYAGAVKKYREALRLWPQNGWAWYELGFTIRTQQWAAAGVKTAPLNSVRINDTVTAKFSPEVAAAFADSRRHTPFQFMAYQGGDQAVIQGFMALVQKVQPAMKTLGEANDQATVDQALQQLAEGCQEAGIHEMALVCRQILVARRGRYDRSDHPFIAASLRKLVPGPETEAVLKRLSGAHAAFRQLIATEDQAYHNPIDGKTYVAPGGWRTYQPQPGAKTEPVKEKVKVDHVRLMTPEDEIASRTSVKDLAKFVKQAEQIASKTFGKSDKGLKLLVEFTCSPSGHELQIAHQPEDVDKELLQAFYAALAKMDKLPVKEGKLAFQIQWTVSP